MKTSVIEVHDMLSALGVDEVEKTREQIQALIEKSIMKSESQSWTSSLVALATAGVTLIGVGPYFVLLRPPLLPEDVRYTALPAAQNDIIAPRLEPWLTHVFRVMGATCWRPEF